ncbi:MAG: glycosyltransferase, partial [Chitinivibrionales bacterium]|nr:glycosyltransferase [Chitinivibrionales bacterium]MBD3395922.1 glycosyltransferase [Chitinivibrionales bacterium]
MPITIGVDIKAFRGGKTGISRYLRAILDRLQEIDTENSYVLFEYGPSVYTPHNPRWEVIPFTKPVSGLVWQQFVLPFLVKRHKVSVLWCPEQVCPLAARTGIVTTAHDLVFVHYPRTLAWSMTLILRTLFPRTLRASDRVAADSEYTRQDVLKTYRGLIDESR